MTAPDFKMPWLVVGRLYRETFSVAWALRRRLFIVLVCLAVALLGLHYWDPVTMVQLATWRTDDVVYWAKLVSFWGELHMAPLLVVALAWAWSAWQRKTGHGLPLLAAVLAMITSGVLVQLLKKLFGRPRPNLPVPDQFDWFHPTWNSFPSGHAMHWAALVGALWFFFPRLAIGVIPMALTVMVARMLVPRHYPTDLLGGAVLGLLCGLCFGLAARNLSQKRDSLPNPTNHE